MKIERFKFAKTLGTGLVLCMPFVASATIYDAAADFSFSPNPNGVWSYGWSQTLGSGFNLDTAVNPSLGGVPGVVQWQGNQPPGADGNPSVFENTTSSSQTISSIFILSHSLAFHPGSLGQYAIVQFTAPSAGSYLISATFQGDDVGYTTTGVDVLVGGTPSFAGVVNGFEHVPGGPATSGSSPITSWSSTPVHLSAGEPVDFMVTTDGKFDNDSTGLQALVTAVPEPTTLIAGALLLLPFGASTLRILRRNRVA